MIEQRAANVTGIVLMVVTTIASGAATPQDDVITTWSSSVWQSAIEGDRGSVDRYLTDNPWVVDRYLTEKPDGPWPEAPASVFRNNLSNFQQNASRSAVEQEDARVAAIARMDGAFDEGDVSEALRAAVEAQTLSANLDDALADPRFQRIIVWAEDRIPEIMRQADWLYAQELLFSLRTFYAETSDVDRYESLNVRLEEVSHRVGLIARYAPRRLHELRVLQAERRDEDVPPPFNESLSDNWKDRIRGVRADILRLALDIAAREHIESTGWTPLLRGGVTAMEFMATTSSLSGTFPSFGDPDTVARWLEGLETLYDGIDVDLQGHAGYRACTVLLDRIVELNASTVDLPPGVLYREFGDGAMEKLDRFTEVIWPDEMRRFKQATEGKFVGVGIMIRENDNGEIMIVNPLEGMPAFFAGVRADDIVAQVDGVSTLGWTLNDAVDRIMGEQGSEVTLGLRRENVGDLLQVTIVRDLIKLHTVMGWWKTGLDETGMPTWDWTIDDVCGIAYIRLSQFTKDTYGDLVQAIREIRREGDLNGLILDLRHNPGGLLPSARLVGNLFVRRGIIVTGEDRNGKQSFSLRAHPNRAYLAEVPTVVLVNQGSASASEIVAGGIQAHDAGVILGTRTFGKGSVQTVHPFSEEAELKLTTQYYRLPSPDGGVTPGRLVHHRKGATVWGVEPDIVVEMTPSQLEGTIGLRSEADRLPTDDEGQYLPESSERPGIRGLLDDGLDPQLQMALLLLQANTLGRIDGELRQAHAPGPAAEEPAVAPGG